MAMSLCRCFISEEERWKITDTVWLEVTVRRSHISTHHNSEENVVIGRIIIGLYGNLVPKTVTNFIKLAENRSYGNCYYQSFISQIEKGHYIQAGGPCYNNAYFIGESIYGKPFKDENFKLKHSKPGIVSMFNHGQKNNNASMFRIVLREMPELDGVCVAFGEVLKGFDVISKLEEIPQMREDLENARTTILVLITNCGHNIWPHELL